MFISMRRNFSFTMLVLLIGACAVTPEPLTDADLWESAEKDHTLMFGEGERITGSLSLEEAIARALKYNLDHRARAMEQALALNQLDLENFDLLPTLTAKAGYSERSEFSATNSKQIGAEPPSGGHTYSADRTLFTGDLTLGWNVLDFGVSYFNARQNADRTLIADERRKKVLHNLVREVQFSYWRMVAAQKLGDRVKLAVTRAEQALITAEKVEEEKLRTPTEMLRYQKRLLQNIRKLEAVRQNLSTARVELAALINVPPSTKFRVVPPLTDKLTIPKWSTPLDKMEILAFHNNPDIREKLYLTRISLDETKKNLVSFFPGIDLSGGQNHDSNSFLDEDHWYIWSANLSLNLLKLLSLPTQIRYNDANVALFEAQRLALRMAVLAQVHVAKRKFLNAVKQFERADRLFTIDKRLSTQIAKRQESDIQSKLDRISQETAAIDSVIRRYQTYSEVIAAIGRIHATLGMDFFSSDVHAENLKDLTRIVGKAMNARKKGSTLAAELKRLEDANPKTKTTADAKGGPVRKNLIARFWNWSTTFFTKPSEPPLNLKPKVDNNNAETRTKKSVENSVEVSLNETRAGGNLNRTSILCGTISKLNAEQGWLKISARASDKRKVVGWLHEIYGAKLTLQCGKTAFAS